MSGGVADGFEEELEQAQIRAAVRQSMKDLPPEQQLAVQLSFFKGLSHSEIAEQLQLPLGTIKSLILLCLRKIREQIQSLQEVTT